MKREVKVGDKIIADDNYINLTRFIEGEVIEVTPYKDVGLKLHTDLSYENNRFGITILGKFKSRDIITDKEYEYTRRIYSCDFMIDPIYDVNTTWAGYNGYAKAIFFTSKENKDNFNELIRIKKMEYHLQRAKSYGYKENI